MDARAAAFVANKKRAMGSEQRTQLEDGEGAAQGLRWAARRAAAPQARSLQAALAAEARLALAGCGAETKGGSARGRGPSGGEGAPHGPVGGVLAGLQLRRRRVACRAEGRRAGGERGAVLPE
ncbi:unnamed protein product, partial [Prorocentrum cordatum]